MNLGVGTLVSIPLALRATYGAVYGSGLMALAFAWGSTTALAVIAVRRGHIQQHREWMIRSYVTTFAFVIIRVVITIAQAAGLSDVTQAASLGSWAGWTLPLLVCELCLQGRKLSFQPRRSELQQR